MVREKPLIAAEIGLPVEQQLHITGNALNSELKSLTIGSMAPGESYSAVSGHDAFLELQGDNPVPSGNRKNQYDYCAKSFLPAGLVYPVDNKGHIEYALTEAGYLQGKACSGVVLAFALAHPELPQVRLMGELSKARAVSRPAYQFSLLNLLSAQPDETPLSRREVLAAAPMPSSTLSFVANSLQAVGLVERSDRSYFSMPQNWHEPISEYCTSIQKILDGNMQAIKAGKTALIGVISNQEAVKMLVQKGYAASTSANHIAPEDMQTLILESVRGGNRTALEVAANITKLHQRSVSPSTVRPALKSLFEQGILAVERSTHSRALFYDLAS